MINPICRSMRAAAEAADAPAALYARNAQLARAGWECGKGLPEVSLMLPLCAALDITFNDLLSGEKVSATDNGERRALIAEDVYHRRHINRSRRLYMLAPRFNAFGSGMHGKVCAGKKIPRCRLTASGGNIGGACAF